MIRSLLLFLFASTLIGEAHAAIRTEKIAYNHEGVHLEGYVAWDDASQQKRPGILVVHEWWGLNDYIRKRATQLAEMGYVAFAVDMFGEGRVTDHPKQASEWMAQVQSDSGVWMGRAMAGMKLLQEHRLVDQQKLAAIGYCFGGATVQKLAFAKTPLQCVVSFHGPPMTPPEDWDGSRAPRVLMCHGSADQFIADDAVLAFQKAMNKANADWQFVSYAGARHAFTNPAAGEYGIENLKYNPTADRRSWNMMREMFSESFGRK